MATRQLGKRPKGSYQYTDTYTGFTCEVTTPAVHTGPVRKYSKRYYDCLDPGEYHYFCRVHRQLVDCPIHPHGYRHS